MRWLVFFLIFWRSASSIDFLTASTSAEAADSVADWTVEDVNEEVGIINVKDDTTWKLYYVKIFIEDLKDGQIKVDLRSFSNYRFPLQDNKKCLAEFFQKLNNLMEK